MPARTTLPILLLIAVGTRLPADERPKRERPPDEVVLRSPSGGRVVQRGTILDYTGLELTLATGLDGPTRTYPAEQVVSVTTPRLPGHAAGAEALAVGRFTEAARMLELAVDTETRVWVRREILALLVRAALASGDGRTARVRFDLLVRSDPETPHFRLIPLTWIPTVVGPEVVAEARSLLVHEIDAMRLVGASLLLSDPEFADAAASTIRRLAGSTDERVRDLAVAQQWRLRIGPTLTEREVERWQRHFDRLPEELRAGPSYVLGHGWGRIGLHDRAAIAFLWAPLADDHDALLASRSLVDAGHALRRIGQDNRAFTLYREAAARYRHTPFAAEASAAIDEMTAASRRPAGE